MLQLPNSPIFEGQEKKTQPIQKNLHAGSELSPPFFLMALQTKNWGIFAWVLWFYAGKIILVPRLGEDGRDDM